MREKLGMVVNAYMTVFEPPDADQVWRRGEHCAFGIGQAG